jgi:hypothetical protein
MKKCVTHEAHCSVNLMVLHIPLQTLYIYGSSAKLLRGCLLLLPMLSTVSAYVEYACASPNKIPPARYVLQSSPSCRFEPMYYFLLDPSSGLGQNHFRLAELPANLSDHEP